MTRVLVHLFPLHLAVTFTQGKPFRPFEQLLGVLPAPSSSLLPAPYKPLMEDSTSPIIDFYPLTFEVRHLHASHPLCAPLYLQNMTLLCMSMLGVPLIYVCIYIGMGVGK